MGAFKVTELEPPEQPGEVRILRVALPPSAREVVSDSGGERYPVRLLLSARLGDDEFSYLSANTPDKAGLQQGVGNEITILDTSYGVVENQAAKWISAVNVAVGFGHARRRERFVLEERLRNEAEALRFDYGD